MVNKAEASDGIASSDGIVAASAVFVVLLSLLLVDCCMLKHATSEDVDAAENAV